MSEPALRAVTGRFQPFHNDHLELVLDALSSGPVIVGITNPDPRSLRAVSSSGHRHRRDANPYTFIERLTMIDASLRESGIDSSRYRIVPFPLDCPAVWRHYIPLAARQIVRCYSDWERDKAEQLAAGGYTVERREGDPASRIRATDIRNAMRAGDAWSQHVPAAVARYLGELRLSDTAT